MLFLEVVWKKLAEVVWKLKNWSCMEVVWKKSEFLEKTGGNFCIKNIKNFFCSNHHIWTQSFHLSPWWLDFRASRFWNHTYPLPLPLAPPLSPIVSLYILQNVNACEFFSTYDFCDLPACKLEDWNVTISHRPHSLFYANSLIRFALPISMPRFESIIFYQNSTKIKLFLEKNAKFSSAGGSAPRPPHTAPHSEFLPTHPATLYCL